MNHLSTIERSMNELYTSSSLLCKNVIHRPVVMRNKKMQLKSIGHAIYVQMC